MTTSDSNYSVIFENHFISAGNVCIFQSNPNMEAPNIFTLVWFSKFVPPSRNVEFNWRPDYNFAWAETGRLEPGVIFIPSQVLDADLRDKNQVTLTCQGKGVYTFTNQTKGPVPGSLSILQDSTIPIDMEVAVGIGMSGQATFAVPAMPNMRAIFTPQPQYWITFGSFMSGLVLDVTQITNKQQIIFGPNIFSMTAILNPDCTWTIMPTKETNAG